MDAGQVAALIAAAFFAIGMCAAGYVLMRLARVISAATRLLTSYQAGADEVLAQAKATVARADEQLTRTGALADGVDDVATSMADLSVQVSAVAGTAKLIASGLGTPVLRLAAAGHGVRDALAMRRSGRSRQRGARREAARAGGGGAGARVAGRGAGRRGMERGGRRPMERGSRRRPTERSDDPADVLADARCRGRHRRIQAPDEGG